MTSDADRSAEIEAWFARLPSDQHAALQAFRATIRAAAPGAVETMGYGVEAFHYRGRALVSYGAAKHHCSFYVQSVAVMEAHAAELAGHSTSKGALRFQPDALLPDHLVVSLVGARMAEVEAATAGRAG